MRRVSNWLFWFTASSLITVLASSSFAAHIQWDSVNDPRVGGYEVHTGSTSGVYDTSAVVMGAHITNWVVENFSSQPVFIAVRARSESGDLLSGFSNEIFLFPEEYPYPVFHTDVDQDGRQDKIFVQDDGLYVAYDNLSLNDAILLLPDAFSPSGGWDYDKHVVKVEDMDSDGYPDVVGSFYNGVQIAFSVEGEEFEEPIQVVSGNFGYGNGWRIEKHPWDIADLDDDGYPDIYGYTSGVVAAYNIDGRVFEAPRYIYRGNFGYGNGWYVDKHPRGVSDLNGNGYLDLWGFATNGLVVAYAVDGRSYENARYVLTGNYGYGNGWRVEQHPRTFADLDDDGLLDIVGYAGNGVVAAYGIDGVSYDTPRYVITGIFGFQNGWNVEEVRTIVDVDGDDFPDFLGWKGDGNFYWVPSIDGYTFETPLVL